MKQQSAQRILTAGRSTVYPDTGSIRIRVFCRQRLYPSYPVGETCIGQVLPAYVMESLAAVGRAHAIDLDNDKTHLRNALHFPVATGEVLRHKGILRACINVFDDGVAFRGIEIGGPDNDTPYLRHAVTAFGVEGFGKAKARGQVQ